MADPSEIGAGGIGAGDVDPAGRVTVRYWAAARAAAGRHHDEVDPGTLAQVLRQVHQLHPDNGRFADVVAICSILVGEAPVGTADHASIDVPPGQSVELLPPFAGGGC